MASSGKDISVLYSSYDIEKYQYMEVKQTESYIKAKHKWLIFHSKTMDSTDDNIVPIKQVVSEVGSE